MHRNRQQSAGPEAALLVLYDAINLVFGHLDCDCPAYPRAGSGMSDLSH
jgi:hypothetical protein